MISKEITICINPGVDCHSIHVDWLGTEGLIIPCMDKNCITVAVDPGNPTQCLEGFIMCLDANGVQSCKNCEPIHFRKCFCTLDSDCGSCGTCGPDGICVDTCTAEQLAQGKVCYPDGCKCPPNKPVLDPKTGKCAECISGTKDPLNPCRICIDGRWVTKSCGPDAVCDQTTGDCIDDCSKNTNGKTRWNPVTKACDCEIGYRWSTVKNTCVVDEDCKPGFRRNPVTDECEEIKCPPGQVYSAEKVNCIDPPCDPTDCESGLDCTGKNCGCSKVTKKCVSCKDDPTALGCNDTCEKEYCDDNTPCGKPGCTCVNNQCVGCNNFPCDKCGLQTGCICTDGVNCKGGEPEGCLDKHDLKFEDCVLKSKLELVNSCNCDGVGTSLRVNHFTKAAGNTSNIYKAEFEIDLRKKFTNNITGYQRLERFKQSDTDINNDFPDTSSCSIEITAYYRDKDNIIFPTPVQTLSSEIKTGPGGAKETYVVFPNITIATDKPVDPLFPTKFVGYKITAYVGVIEFAAKGCIYARAKIYQTGSNDYESIALSTTPRYVTLSNLSTTSKRNPLLTWKRGEEVVRKLFIQPTRPGVYEDQINGPKKLSLVERGKQDLTGAEGELLALKDYTTHWDCGCDREKTIKEIFKCDIVNWKNNDQFRISTSTGSPVCNNQLVLLKEHVPCFINQDLEFFGWGANHPSQTKYIVSITDKKGVKVDAGTFVYKNTGETTGYFRKDGTNEQFEGFIYNHSEEISSVSIKMNHDNGCILSDSVTLDVKDAEVKLDCIGSFNRATINSRGTAIKKVEIPALNISSNVSESGTTQVIIDNLPQNVDIKFVITYINNCKKEQRHKKNCCDSDSLELAVQGLVEKTLVIQTKNKAKLKSIVINGTEQISKITENSNVYNIALKVLNNPETVSVSVMTDNNCPFSMNDFDCGDNFDIVFELVPNPICAGETSKATVLNAPPNTNIIMSSPNGSTASTVSNNTGYAEFLNLSTPGEYFITRVGDQAITDEIRRISLIVEPAPVVHSLELEGGISPRCSGSDISVKVRGSIGSLVKIIASNVSGFNSQAEAKLDTPVSGSATDGFGIVTFNFIDEGTYTFTSSDITKGRCSATSDKSVSVEVEPKIRIIDIQSQCQSPFGPNADVKVIITLSEPGSISVKNTYSDFEVVMTNPVLPNVYEGIVTAGSDRDIEITVSSGACQTVESYKLTNCNCVKPTAPLFNDYLACFPGSSLDITTGIVGDPNIVVDLFFNNSLTAVKRLTKTDASYQITNSNQFGKYTPVSVDLMTGCTNTGNTFNVGSGDFILELTGYSDTLDYCSGTPIQLTALVSGGANLLQMKYKWFVNDVEQVGKTTASFSYTHPKESGNPNVDIRVEARRDITVFPTGSISPTCFKSVTKTMEFIECCPELTLVYNGFESTQCDGIVMNVTAPVGTPLPQDVYYNLYYPANSLTIIKSGVARLGAQKIKITRDDLIPGANEYKLRVGYSNNPTCYKDITFSHSSAAICQDANYLFVIDNSGSIDAAEFTAISNQIIYLSQQLHANNSNTKFGVVHYYGELIEPKFDKENLGDNLPLTYITRSGAGQDFLQECLALFNINDFTGFNPLNPTKMILFTDAVGSLGSTIAYGWVDNNVNTNLPLAIPPRYGVNFLNSFTYPASDAIKAGGVEIYVVRYPHSSPYAFALNSTYATTQAVTDEMLKKVASPGKFFSSTYSGTNEAILSLLSNIGCNCGEE